MSDRSPYPVFSDAIICPICGERPMNGVELTETGQGQMTDAVLGEQ